MNRSPNRVVRKLELMRNRFTYEKRRPRLEPAEVNRRLTTGVGLDAGAPGGFAAILTRHLDATVPLFGPGRAAPDAGVAAAPDVDWHREDHFGVDWPQRYVGAVSDHLPGSDIVLLWHKNKMMFLLDLAARYRHHADEDARGQWFRAVESWCRQNPYMVGMNWRSALEVGTRLVVWSQGLAWMKGAPPPAEETCALLVRSVLRQAEFLATHFSIKDVPNNHLVGEAATLYAFAAQWPLLRAAQEWVEKGESILVHELERQVLPDGMQYEVAVNYHLYVLDFALLYLCAKAARGEAPPASVSRATAEMIDAALTFVSPSGRMPRVGDDSISRFFTIDPAALAAVPSGDVDMQLDAGRLLRPEVAAALSSTQWGRKLVERRVPVERTHAFRDAGVAVARRRRSHLVFTAGPQHTRAYSPGHLHADAASFELEVDGTVLVVDSGTYLYTYDRSLRDHFRGAAAHNTVLVDDAEPAEPARGFAWKQVHTGRLTRAAQCVGGFGDAVLFACEREIPGNDNASFTHRRVLLQLGALWLVADAVTPRTSGSTAGVTHNARAYFHTPLESGHAVGSGARKVGLYPPGGGEWFVDVFSTGDHEIEVLDTGADRAALYSPRYGELRTGTTLRTSLEVGAGCAFLHVVRDGDTSVDTIEWEGRRALVTLVGPAGNHRVTLDPEAARAGVDGVAVGD